MASGWTATHPEGESSPPPPDPDQHSINLSIGGFRGKLRHFLYPIPSTDHAFKFSFMSIEVLELFPILSSYKYVSNLDVALPLIQKTKV
jgi:hypothetical protein